MTKEEVEEVQYLLTSPIWLNLIAPRIKAKLDQQSRKLVLAENLKKAQENKLRGWILALNWMLNSMEQEVKEFLLAEQQEKEHNKKDMQAEFYAEFGRTSPFSPPVDNPQDA